MKWIPFLLLFTSFSHFVFTQDIRIGIFQSQVIQEIKLTCKKGDYLIIGDSTFYYKLNPNESITILKEGTKVSLKRNNQLVNSFHQISIRYTIDNATLNLQTVRPRLLERNYLGSFSITAKKDGLSIVNVVDIRHYIEGVVESEGGGNKKLEYYKAQAVISRTYALKHINRHIKEGFNLCDQVHCQAYYNKSTYTKDIGEAVKLTHGVYVEDSVTKDLVEGYFYSNCGGETSSPDYVWRESIHYLQPVKDTFCLNSNNSNWEVKIPKFKWRNFLIQKYFYPIDDSLYESIIYTFQQNDRKAFYIDPSFGIPLRDLRYHFNLKSTYFSCYPDGDFVVVKGRGFGHGVGMCQEGAMRMAELGYHYKQILSFYFKDIKFNNYLEQFYFNQLPSYFEEVN